jgi:WD40 repeat protein
MSEEGSYAVVTRDDSYRSIVYYYNRDFKPINQIKKDKYVTALAFTSDGGKLAIASVYDNGGDFECEIQVIKGKAAEAEFTIVESGLVPINAKWLNNGNLCILYSQCAVVYSEQGEKLSSIDFLGLQSLTVALNDDIFASVYNSTVLGYDKTVDVYDNNTDKKYSMQFEGDVISVKAHSGKVCILLEDRLLRIDPIKGIIESASVEPNAKDIVFFENTVMICYSGGAFPAVFSAEE